MRVSLGIISALLVSLSFGQTSFGQTSPAKLEFEVASVRPSAPSAPEQVKVGLHIDGAQVRCNYLSLSDYLGIAYRVKANQISGPEWITSERFDISAKLPSGATQEQIPEMMQNLLADRFQMTLHRESKELPVYMLEVAKGGLKLKESPPDPDSDATDDKSGLNVAGGGSRDGISVDLGKGAYYAFANNRFEAKKVTMLQLAGILERFMDRPIQDKTNLKGRYEVTLDVSQDDYRWMLIHAGVSAGVVLPPEALRLIELPGGDTLMTALQKAGLTLTPRKGSLEMLVVDRAQKTPLEN